MVPPLLEWLRSRKIAVHMDQETAASIASKEPAYSRAEFPADLDLVVVLGGDGTLLAAARALSGRDVPILAVNLGSLGFLTAVPLEEMYSSLEQVLSGRQEEDCRRLLLVEVVRAGKVASAYPALNDAVINKAAIARILDFEVSVNGQFVSNYKADGMIVSTPTGSTGYSLAAGGPIILPTVQALLITPICSHTLNHRPLVLRDEDTIEVLVHSQKEPVVLTVDGQVGMPILDQDRVVCRRFPHPIRLVRSPAKGYFEILRNKLKWGQR